MTENQYLDLNSSAPVGQVTSKTKKKKKVIHDLIVLVINTDIGNSNKLDYPNYR